MWIDDGLPDDLVNKRMIGATVRIVDGQWANARGEVVATRLAPNGLRVLYGVKIFAFDPGNAEPQDRLYYYVHERLKIIEERPKHLVDRVGRLAQLPYVGMRVVIATDTGPSSGTVVQIGNLNSALVKFDVTHPRHGLEGWFNPTEWEIA